MDIVKVTIECPAGYEDKVIAYVNEAIKLLVTDDQRKVIQPDIDIAVEAILAPLSDAKLEVAVIEDVIIEEKLIG